MCRMHTQTIYKYCRHGGRLMSAICCKPPYYNPGGVIFQKIYLPVFLANDGIIVPLHPTLYSLLQRDSTFLQECVFRRRKRFSFNSVLRLAVQFSRLLLINQLCPAPCYDPASRQKFFKNDCKDARGFPFHGFCAKFAA